MNRISAAIAAALRFPERQVVAVAGDGDFLMNGQELATAIRHGVRLLILVVDNGAYGTIRMHQERDYPQRISGTELVNPDFAALARAYGLHGEVVRREDPVAVGRELDHDPRAVRQVDEQRLGGEARAGSARPHHLRAAPRAEARQLTRPRGSPSW